MTPPKPQGSNGENDLPDPLQRAIDRYLAAVGKGRDSSTGAYRRNASREIETFAEWLADNGVEELDEIDEYDLADYVRQELLTRDLKPQSVRKYYDYLAAWIAWAARHGLVDAAYGQRDIAREPLPETDERQSERQQSWTSEQRQALLEYCDERAREAIDADGTDAYKPVRDRALVAIVAITGLRGSELLANTVDERRDGARWSDLAADRKSIVVLDKGTQEWDDRPVPPQARPAIDRWETVLDPEPDWPLIPTLHYPSLYDVLREAGVETDGLSGFGEIFDAIRAADERPPAMTTDGARRLLKQLTDETEIDADGEYLKPHGARRGLGYALAKEASMGEGAKQLGNSVEVFEDAYGDIRAAEQADATGEALDRHDS